MSNIFSKSEVLSLRDDDDDSKNNVYLLYYIKRAKNMRIIMQRTFVTMINSSEFSGL